MKAPEAVRTTILLIGHRRPWKRQVQLTGRHWPFVAVFAAGLTVLALTAGTYQIWSRWATVTAPGHARADYRALARQVATISIGTQAGLGALAGELRMLRGDAARLAVVSRRMAGMSGVAPTAFDGRGRQYASVAKTSPPTAAPDLLASLRNLATRLRLQAHRAARRTT